MSEISELDYSELWIELGAAKAKIERLRVVLETVLRGVQWDEKPGHINGLKIMILSILAQTKQE